MRVKQRPIRWSLPRLLVLPAFLLVYAYGAWHWSVGVPVGLVYLVASLAAFVVYAVDKSAARQGRWRMPEKTLHALSLAGGWPGALLAQQWLRHKCTKPAFVAAYWGTVVLNVAAFLAVYAPMAGHLFG